VESFAPIFFLTQLQQYYIIIIIIIIIIIMKSSTDRDNNYCHYVIQRIAGFAITLYYYPAGLGVVMVVYHLL
jgi:hypothetical protein